MTVLAFFFWICAAAAALYGLSVAPELMEVLIRRDATVWQQISARLAAGLSLIAFLLAAGAASLLQAAARQRDETARAASRIVKNILWGVEKLSGDTSAAAPPPERPRDNGSWRIEAVDPAPESCAKKARIFIETQLRELTSSAIL